jgi:hypothetical protein
MPETRQAAASQSAELRTDMRETMRSELKDFFWSSEFKEILSKALSTLVEEFVHKTSFGKDRSIGSRTNKCPCSRKRAIIPKV